MFQNYLAWSASSGADDKAVPCGFDNLDRHKVQVVYAENAFNLSEEARQEPEIATCHSNQACNHIWEKLFVWETHAGWCPPVFKQSLDLLCAEETELMDKTDARVELRKASDSFLYSGHADEH